nr:prolyl oligopeptidase family protein [Mycolicibacterium komanii]
MGETRDDGVSGEPVTGTPHRLPSPVGAVGAAVGPFFRTGRYYADSWREFLHPGSAELPIARPTIALAVHALRDEVALLGLKARRPVSDAEVFTRIESEVIAALEVFGDRGWLDHPTRYFARPPRLETIAIHPVNSFGRQYERFWFESGYRPRPEEPGAQRWLEYSSCKRVYGLMLRHEADRPWLVCVHGAEMGRAALDLTVFRAWHLHKDLNVNVVLPVLPMHGPRGRGLPKGAVFPGENILDTVHATAQAVWDIRRLLHWIRAQQPAPPVGVYGISLGGYVSGLVASLEQNLTCAILGVPVADLIAVLGRHSGLGKDDPRRRTVELAEPIGRMTSPLAMKPRVPLRGRFIYAGIADQLVHPRDQVVRLWQHWGEPEIHWYRGGHTGFVQARPVEEFVDAALIQSGLLEGPEPTPAGLTG